METVLIPLKEVTANATIPQLKYWSKLSGIALVVRGRVAHVRPEDAETLCKITLMVAEGSSPQDAVKTLGKSPDHRIIASVPVEILPDCTARLDALEKSMMLMVERLSRQENQIASQEKMIVLQERELSDQRKELATLRLPTLLLNAPPRIVKPWQPIRVQPVPMPWYERLWVQMFNPETLREATE